LLSRCIIVSKTDLKALLPFAFIVVVIIIVILIIRDFVFSDRP
jgi:hypothetical protein